MEIYTINVIGTKNAYQKYITNPSNLPKMGQQKKPLSGLGQCAGKEKYEVQYHYD